MKVIDLLNKVVKGKPIKKFKFKGDTFNYYEHASTLEELYYYDNLEWLSRENINLNDEVEIIEEDKEYEDIEELNKNKFYDNRFPDNWEEEIIHKIDTLVRNQKKIIEKLNKGDDK
jgi:hypothetical protein